MISEIGFFGEKHTGKMMKKKHDKYSIFSDDTIVVFYVWRFKAIIRNFNEPGRFGPIPGSVSPNLPGSLKFV